MNLSKIKRASSRLLVRYVPAVGTLLLTKVLLDSYSAEDYARFALVTSFAALIPVLDLGGGTKAVLVSGNLRQTSSLVLAPLLLSLLFGAAWLVSGAQIVLNVFLVSIPTALYIVARANYAYDGADDFNRRAMILYPLGFLLIYAVLQLERSWAPAAAGLFVMYFALIAGSRPRYVMAVMRRIVLRLKWRDALPEPANFRLVLLSGISFAGVFSNVAYLEHFGTAAEVQTYDLIWRMLSVTLFAQLYLAHSFPDVVRKLSNRNAATNKQTFYRLMQIAIILTIAQTIVAALIFPFYASYFGFELNWAEVGAGLFLCIVFSMIIPVNQVMMATARFNNLIVLFMSSAALANVIKFQLPPTAQNAFFSSALGYVLVLVAGSFVILREGTKMRAP